MKIFEQFGTRQSSNLEFVDKLLHELIVEMSGLFIVDFIDLGNWDQLGSYEIDYENGFLLLRWHRFYEGNSFGQFLITYPNPRVFTLLVHFKDIYIEMSKGYPFVTIRGYALKEKEILGYFNRRGLKSEKYQEEIDRNFCQIFEIEHNDYTELCWCLNTPIYSIMLVPKDSASSVDVSAELLFLFNYNNCLRRLKKAMSAILTNNFDEDELCEKANTARRIFEYVLKIECCYRINLDLDIVLDDNINKERLFFGNKYSDKTLGDLINSLKQIKDQSDQLILNSIVRLANELSHDSGKEITKEKAIQLLEQTIQYTEELSSNLVKRHFKKIKKP